MVTNELRKKGIKILFFRNGLNVGYIPSFSKWIIVFLCFAFFLYLTKPTLGAGVTIVTHGWIPSGIIDNECDKDNWVNQMGDAVAARAGSSTAVYNMHVYTTIYGALYVEFNYEKGDIPNFSLNPNSEVVIKLYWDAISIDLLVSSTSIAKKVEPYLSSWNAGPGLVKPLAEMPIHLIGHSRGGSVVSEIAKLLAETGIWVDQVTTLDPHPLVSYGDPDVLIYDNVIFADNYFQTGGGECILYSEYLQRGYKIDNAYNQPLIDKFSQTNLIQTCYHSLVHYWYHGTIDLSELLKLDCDTITKDIRDIWYTPNDFGYKLSRIANGQTLRGTLGPKEGLKWADAHRSNNYTRIESDNQWPNIELENIDDKWDVTLGDTVRIQYRYQDYDTSTSIELITDVDRNPYNNSSEKTIFTATLDSTGSTVSLPIDFSWTPKADDNGKYLYAKITDYLGLTRYYYLGKPFNVLNTTKPTISITFPTNGSTVSDSITITTTVSNNVSKVEFYFNDSNKFTDSSNPFERVWNTKDYANGGYTIKAIAFDINGNASEPAIVTVMVNNTSSNKPPNTPTDLAQYKSNGATSIAVGSSTNERIVVMKGKVTDPDNNPVSLEVEFKPIGTSFSNVPSPEGVSGGTVASGQIAVVTCSGLADGQYHWQARAKDSKGAVSNWLSMGGNSESVPDFVVSASLLKVGDWVQTNALVNVRDTPGGNLIV